MLEFTESLAQTPEAIEGTELFLAQMGGKYHVPVMLFSAISTSLSVKQFPYFVRIAETDSSQVNALAAIIQAYQWKEVVLIHDVNQSGTAVIPYLLTGLLQEIGVSLSSRVVLPHAANRTVIISVLRKLTRTNMRVYVVHLSSSLGSHFFLHVRELQLMQVGYAWITACGLTNLLGYMDSSILHSMEGVIGVRTHVLSSKCLRKLKHQLRSQSRQKNPKIKASEPNVYALWAYDAIFLMAMAADKAISHRDQSLFSNSQMTGNSLCLSDRGASPLGSILLQSMLKTRFSGLSGEWTVAVFHI